MRVEFSNFFLHFFAFFLGAPLDEIFCASLPQLFCTQSKTSVTHTSQLKRLKSIQTYIYIKNGAGRSRVQGETGRTSGEVRGPSRGASRGWISETIFFLFCFWCPSSVADFVHSQLTFQRES